MICGISQSSSEVRRQKSDLDSLSYPAVFEQLQDSDAGLGVVICLFTLTYLALEFCRGQRTDDDDDGEDATHSCF